MTTTATVNCPFCDARQTINVYRTVNTTVDPSLKDKVKNGILNDKNCTGCGKNISIVSGFLYHDILNKVIISLNTTEEPAETFTENNPFVAQEGYIVREVRTYPELLEKIEIFDQGLNDLVLKEIADNFRTAFKEVVDAELYIFFRKIEKSLFKKKIVFQCFTHPEQLMEISQPFSKLTKLQKQKLFDIEVLRYK